MRIRFTIDTVVLLDLTLFESECPEPDPVDEPTTGPASVNAVTEPFGFAPSIGWTPDRLAEPDDEDGA